MQRRYETIEVDVGQLGEAIRLPVTFGTRITIDSRALLGAFASGGTVAIKRAIVPGAQARDFASAVTIANPNENAATEIDLTAAGNACAELVVEVTTAESGKKLALGILEDDPA